ncbi:hypothetical protein DOTSEDRAFT_79017 [Dothistroma septosporum NZE10]|uniref:Indoleamine 2,3-dioxygenase n=1 Tax=Dothistroma septosporum (strain NZE10 / CBS 128990) TaxID=675120 RepID=N1PU59_DOTSN|nr:hypothetical protein DOTSEDRAFT_79017 [Dothistroma septosporum NZE10]
MSVQCDFCGELLSLIPLDDLKTVNQHQCGLGRATAEQTTPPQTAFGVSIKMLSDISIPVPEAYQVSSRLGFLPVERPDHSLLDPYYKPWVAITESLPEMLAGKRVRETVDDLPILSCDRLKTTRELRTAYSMLAFICHAYIWEGETPAETVPPSISCPFLLVCESLELPPVATYAAVVLWNYRPIASKKPLNNVENLASGRTFTSEKDESWFYNISVAIEAHGGPLITVLLEAVRSARAGDQATVAAQLCRFEEGIRGLCTLLRRMYEGCDPQFFYHRLRPYLAGSKNVASAGLAKGVVFDTGDESCSKTPVQFAGGSNAQSSLTQFFDIALGIVHHRTKLSGNSRATASDVASRADFITDMRQYMPGPHRRFLQHFSLVANIRAFVTANTHYTPLRSSYDASVAALVDFRNIHLEMVSRYIVLPQALAAKNERPAALEDAESEEPTGTGGTTVMPFLKQARDETKEALTDDIPRQPIVLDVGNRGRSVHECATRYRWPLAARWQQVAS